MPFDRTVYFDSVRGTIFGGTMDPGQVTGQSALLFVWEQAPHMPSLRNSITNDLRHFAYMLSTVVHETALTCWPIEEYGKGAGHSYGEPDPVTGEVYFGRGYVQLTWKENYVRAARELGLVNTPGDLEWHPIRALDIIIATLVMFRGMGAGWFTGMKLGDYFDDSTDDPVGARRIINPDDKGPLIAGYHADFLAALQSSWSDAKPAPAPPQPVPGPVPEPSLVTITIGVQAAGPVNVTIKGE